MFNLYNLHNLYKNETCYIIGGGPSLLSYIHNPFITAFLEKQLTVGTNKSYLWFIQNYLLIHDIWFWNNYASTLASLDCELIIPTYIPLDITQYNNILYIKSGPSMQLLPERIDLGISYYNNAGLSALRFAYGLGCTTIYLLGIDLQHTHGMTHFHVGYPTQNILEGKYKLMLSLFKETLQAFDKKNITVISCSALSPLNTYIPYIALEEHIRASS